LAEPRVLWMPVAGDCPSCGSAMAPDRGCGCSIGMAADYSLTFWGIEVIMDGWMVGWRDFLLLSQLWRQRKE
jgi:hypothetical protein